MGLWKTWYALGIMQREMYTAKISQFLSSSILNEITGDMQVIGMHFEGYIVPTCFDSFQQPMKRKQYFQTDPSIILIGHFDKWCIPCTCMFLSISFLNLYCSAGLQTSQNFQELPDFSRPHQTKWYTAYAYLYIYRAASEQDTLLNLLKIQYFLVDI